MSPSPSHTRQIFLHNEFKNQIESKHAQFKKKTDWLISQLILEGRLDGTKGTGTYNQPCKWRRNPIRGSHYYLWWIPLGTEGTNHLNSLQRNNHEEIICIRTITDHAVIDKREAISLGNREDYYNNRVDILDLKPYESEQAEIINKPVADFFKKCQIDIVLGSPGSGKTVALKYALRELWLKHFENKNTENDARFLYITYTSALRTDAENFCRAYEIDSSVDVVTLQDLVQKKLDDDSPLWQTTDASFKEFKKFLNTQGNQLLGQAGLKQWKYYIEDLWIEIRSNILGLSMPDEWERGDGLKIFSNHQKIIDAKSYGKLRYKEKILASSDLNIAYSLAREIKKDERSFQTIFPELFNLEKVLWKEKISYTKEKYAALIVDEIQDLTLSQIALIIKIAQETQNQNLPYRILLAGDESQTVQPSGFDWKFTKDILRKKFDVDAQECVPLSEQKRSPHPLNLLIRQTKSLYKYIPQALRPKDQNVVNNHTNIEQKKGRLVLCDVSTEFAEKNIFEDLEKYSGLGLVIIDLLNELQHPPLTNCITQIKGLEKEYVIVYNLDKQIERLKRNSSRQIENKIYALENRRIIDNIRVAVSRSTYTLILLAEKPNIISQEFSAIDFISSTWFDVCRILRNADQESDQLEKVNNLISDLKASLDQENIDGAKRFLDLLKSEQFYIDDNQILKDIEAQEFRYNDLSIDQQRNRIDQKIRIQFQDKFIDDISESVLGELAENIFFLQSQEESIYGEIKGKTQELKFGVEYLSLLKQYPKDRLSSQNIKELITYRISLIEKYRHLERFKSIQNKIHQKRIDWKYYRKYLWNYAENIRNNQKKRQKEWKIYIQAINMAIDLSTDDKSKILTQISTGWQSFYPIHGMSNVEDLCLKAQCIFKYQENSRIKAYTAQCWAEDFLGQLSILMKSSNHNFNKKILESSILMGLITAYINLDFDELKNIILSQSRVYLDFEESLKIYQTFGDTHPLELAYSNLTVLEQELDQVKMEDVEADYFFEYLGKTQSLVKMKMLTKGNAELEAIDFLVDDD